MNMLCIFLLLESARVVLVRLWLLMMGFRFSCFEIYLLYDRETFSVKLRLLAVSCSSASVPIFYFMWC